jgi:alpha-glucosidase (family GH31 glycosyl hydrolase)
MQRRTQRGVPMMMMRQGQLQSFVDKVPIDGVWIDMNEASNFCNLDGTTQVRIQRLVKD